MTKASELLELLESINIDIGEMAKVSPKTSKLPVALYISPETPNKHIPRLKVSNTPGARFNQSDNFTLTISYDPILLSGECKLSSKDLLKVQTWIILNRRKLTKYWYGEYTDTMELLSNLKPVGSKR